MRSRVVAARERGYLTGMTDSSQSPLPPPLKPDLAGGYDEAPAERGPSPDAPTVDTDPEAGGPGFELDLTGYAVVLPDGRRGVVARQVGTAPHIALVVDGLDEGTTEIAMADVTQVDHQDRTLTAVVH